MSKRKKLLSKLNEYFLSIFQGFAIKQDRLKEGVNEMLFIIRTFLGNSTVNTHLVQELNNSLESSLKRFN